VNTGENCDASMIQTEANQNNIDSLQRVNKYRVIGDLYNQGLEKWKINGIKF
jgi:hypothetical protein